jgi:hypothetical protein
VLAATEFAKVGFNVELFMKNAPLNTPMIFATFDAELS